jgi:flagellar biosynthesis protein FlhG
MTTSSPTEPVSLPPAAGKTGRVIAVASGKGGVGKTWFAITLCHALARRGGRALLVDGDLGLANVDIQLGLLPETDIGAIVAGRGTLAEAVVRHEAGFDVLAGRSGSGALASLDEAALTRVLDAIHEAAARYDTVILDLGAGVDPALRRMARFADLLVIVATEEPTSLTDAYALLKLHRSEAGDIARTRIVVNQAGTKAAGERTFATLARASAVFLGGEPTLGGVIRRDERVREAIRRQIPLLTRHPTSAAATDVEAIAAALTFG